MRLVTITLLMLLAICPDAAALKRIAHSAGIAQQMMQSDVALVGKVTGFEKECTEIKANPGDKETTSYNVAIVKVETAILGIKNTTHIKVGFIRRAEPQNEVFFEDEPQRNLNLDENGEYLLLLRKHPVESFYFYTHATPPSKLPADAAIAEAKLAVAAIADPMKALKAEKAQDRALAAIVLLMHHRKSAGKGEVDLVPIDAEENAAILKSIAEGDFTVAITGHTTLYSAYQFLGLSGGDGWTHPTPKPGENHNLVMQKAFQDWLAGPGAKFRFQKYVLKAKKWLRPLPQKG